MLFRLTTFAMLTLSVGVGIKYVTNRRTYWIVISFAVSVVVVAAARI